MEAFFSFWLELPDIVLNLDSYLSALLERYGVLWLYVILFVIIFAETGLVIMPFLPGDSLLFAAGALAGSQEQMQIGLLTGLLLLAAVLGDNLNYWIGRWVGKRILSWAERTRSRLFNRKAYDAAHNFYERWGWLTMLMARFVPVIRTFAPFVAGVASMHYPKYFFFDLLGGIIWVFSLTQAGYWFGSHPFVRANFGIVIIAIITVSVMPIVIGVSVEWLKKRRKVAQDS